MQIYLKVAGTNVINTYLFVLNRNKQAKTPHIRKYKKTASVGYYYE